MYNNIFSASASKGKILYPLWFLLIVVFDRGVKTEEKNNSDGHLSEKSWLKLLYSLIYCERKTHNLFVDLLSSKVVLLIHWLHDQNKTLICDFLSKLNRTLRASPKETIFFLNARNRDFGKKLPTTASLNGYPNIAIVYFGFFTSQI